MKQNKYDDDVFFSKYSKMRRSREGLEGAGEWHELVKMLPDFHGKRVLDLGCGFGWHCQYALDYGARSVTGVDISEKMLLEAKARTSPVIRYICLPMEDIDFPADSFDVVISSLAFHYVQFFKDIVGKVAACLSSHGEFVFSVEHPIFTACGTQDWHYDGQGNRLHWPVDQYFTESKRDARFLGESVTKYHRTLTTYVSNLLELGFEVTGLVEPTPPEDWLHTVSGMSDELRRPMMLLISGKRKS